MGPRYTHRDYDRFRDDQWLDARGSPLTNAATVTKRLRRADFGRLEIELTVDDPKAYTTPWTVKLEQAIVLDTEMLDAACWENEKDIPHLLNAKQCRTPVTSGADMSKTMTLALVAVGSVVTAAAALAQTARPLPSAGQLKAGQTLKECRNCPELVVLPSGSFMMGSPADEPERRENERHHRVTIARPLRSGRPKSHGISGRHASATAGATALASRTRCGPMRDGTPNKAFVDWGRGTRPVVGVSWFDAQTFVGWLNWKTGEDDAYRLPSEAEWEYAARAGTTTAYPWGAKLDHNYGNFGIPGPGLGGKPKGAIMGRPDGPCRVVPGERVRSPRHARQRVRVGRGLLRGRPGARTDRRVGQQGGQLRQSRLSRWYVSEQSVHAAFGETRRAVPFDAARPELSRIPHCEDTRLRGSAITLKSV